MNRKRLLTGVLFLLSVLAVQAVPAKRVVKTFMQGNGTSIDLTLCGDEYFSYYTDAEGHPYLLRNGLPERITQKQVGEIWTARKSARMEKMTFRSRARGKAGIPSSATTGKHRGLVILMQFTDVTFVSENPQAVFNRFFNEEGYSDDGMIGSVRDYFLKQSYGQLEIDFDIVGPYTTKHEMAYYGANDEDGNDFNAVGMVAEGVDAASADVDYSVYDWDSDGEVDQVFVIYAGYNEAHGADENTIWPHEYQLAAMGLEKTYNNVKINVYGCSSELKGNGKQNKGILDGIGTACHEFSHCLGLPDMYDTASSNFGMCSWDVMDMGCYNQNSCIPAGYTSYERMFVGWLQPTEINTMTRISEMKPLATNKEAYILYNEGNKNEYYLLENRQPVDFDKGLSGHGLLILHVDYSKGAWMSNTINNTSDHQRMTIIPADNSLKTSSSDLAGDPWPGTKNNTALTNYTTPAATTYNFNTDNQKLMSKPIDNIVESEDGLISFVACRPELDVPEPDDGKEIEGESSFTISWPAVSGAVGYELEVTEIGTASDNPSEALQSEFNFEKTISKSTGFSDISSNLTDYELKGWTGSKLFTTPNKLRIGTSTATGYVRTATWHVPQSSELTVVMGANVVKDGTIVKGLLRLAYGNEGDKASYEDASFTVTGDDMIVFHFTVRKDLFWLEIRPESQMYLNYLAIYDGTWSAEQLGIESQNTSRQMSPKKTTIVTKYTTETNTFTLKDLNVKNRFAYRVRAVGEENTYSQWSKEKTFSFGGSVGINAITYDHQSTGTIYDLQGRSLGTDDSSLRKGIYIISGKKVMK